MNITYVNEPKKPHAAQQFIISGTLANSMPEFKVGNWKIKGIHGFSLFDKNGIKLSAGVLIDKEFLFTMESIYCKDIRIESLEYLKCDIAWKDRRTVKININNHLLIYHFLIFPNIIHLFNSLFLNPFLSHLGSA